MTATVDAGWTLKPGVHPIPPEDYHSQTMRERYLSSTGIRLLTQTCPAVFRWQQLNAPEHKDVFDFGKAAHAIVLGDGPELVVVDAPDWRTKNAQLLRDTARAEGKAPVLTHEAEQILGMADALREHPLAGQIFNPDRGRPEQTLLWRDPPTGVWCRALIDWLPDPTGRRLILADYKTARSAKPEEFARAAKDYGYAQQADHYLTGVTELDLAERPAFVFVVQEKTPPYVVTVIELDATALAIGRFLNRRAITTYAECLATDRWPGYSDDVELTSLPAWYTRQFEDDI